MESCVIVPARGRQRHHRGERGAALMRILPAAVAVLLSAAPCARAQQPRGRLGLAGGLEWMGGSSFGSAAANEITASGAPSPLFSTTSDLSASAGVSVKVGFRITRLFELEADGAYLRPSISAHITGDVEGAPGLTVADRLRQFTVQGSVLYGPNRWDRRVRPF